MNRLDDLGSLQPWEFYDPMLINTRLSTDPWETLLATGLQLESVPITAL